MQKDGLMLINGRKDKKLVSIVTVVYNAVNELEETILSILSLKEDYIEYIIIDGGSTDGTVELIKKYDGKIDLWTSEPDKGIYNAMNKAKKNATGDFILNINVGDRLLSIPTNMLVNCLNEDKDALCGCVQLSTGEIAIPSFTGMIKLNNTIPHQGIFYRRGIFNKYLYNEEYKVFADFDLNQRLYKNKCSFLFCNDVIAYHDLGGISLNKKYVKEFFEIIQVNFGLFFCFLSFLKCKYTGLKYRLKR